MRCLPQACKRNGQAVIPVVPGNTEIEVFHSALLDSEIFDQTQERKQHQEIRTRFLNTLVGLAINEK
jgi:hypothetical protein